MRALALLPLAACLSSPTGLDNTWPPSGTEVVTAVAGDVDGDDQTDLIIAVTGEHPGLYLVRGGEDLVLANAAPISKFSLYYPRPVERPIAVLLSGDDVLVATRGTGGIEIERLDAETLVPDGESKAIEIQEPDDQVWMNPITFPGGQPRLAIGADSEIKHASTGLEMINAIPSPTGPADWREPLFAISYDNAGAQTAVVATRDELYRSAIPAMGNPGFEDWVSLRGAPLPWLGQTSADLDGDGAAEIYGYDLLANTVCAFESSADPTLLQPSCVQAPAPLQDATVTLLISTIDPNEIPDIAIVFSNTEETRIELLINCRFDTTTSTFTTMGPGPPGTALPLETRAAVIVRQNGIDDVFAIGADGTSACDPNSPSC